MAGILVKTLQLLVGELEISRKRLDKAEPLDSKKLDYYYQFQNLINESADNLAGYLAQRKGYGVPSGDRKDESKFQVDYFIQKEKYEFKPKTFSNESQLFEFPEEIIYAKKPLEQKKTDDVKTELKPETSDGKEAIGLKEDPNQVETLEIQP